VTRSEAINSSYMKLIILALISTDADVRVQSFRLPYISLMHFEFKLNAGAYFCQSEGHECCLYYA
jgi:hypothetical protein